MSTASTPIEIRGRYFWRANERFLIRGVVYQCDGYNELADENFLQLQHDIQLFKELDLNAIYVYSIDNTKSHDKSMKLLEEAGIYVLATLATPAHSINRMRPNDSYTPENVSHFLRTADVLSAYPNCIGLVAADSVINSRGNLHSAPVIRAVVRDIKRYLRLKHKATGQRILPVGYSAADVMDLETGMRNYFTAGDEAERVDFWAKSDFSWASPSSIQISGYRNKIKAYSDFNTPTFFSEFGTNTNPPRDFGEIEALLSPEMSHIFSGGFAYEFWRRANGYGIVKQVSGKEAVKYRKAQARFEDARADRLATDMANLTLGEWATADTGVEGSLEGISGTSRRLEKTIAEHRMTSLGDLLMYKDFMNLKGRIAANKDVEAKTDPEWADSDGSVSRAPAFPTQRGFEDLEDPPQSCVDWQELEVSLYAQ